MARLHAGRITGHRRSATAIERTRARNAEHVAAGRLVLHQVALAASTVERQRWTGVRLQRNVLWTSPADAESEVLARVLSRAACCGRSTAGHHGPAPDLSVGAPGRRPAGAGYSRAAPKIAELGLTLGQGRQGDFPGTTVSVGILGPLEVAVGGRPVDVGATKLRVLLSAMVLSANRVVSSDQLIDAVWGDAPPAAVRSTLQGYVHRLRRVLGEGDASAGIVTRDGGYLLCLPPEHLDAARFESQVRDARRHLPDAPAAAARALADALALWRGPALVEVAHLGFALPEAARLEEARLRAIEDRVVAELALGHHPELVGELDGLVRAHPLREHLAAQLMVALYRSGRQAEALDAYQRLRRDLREGLGIEPGPEVAALEEAILLQKPELRWVHPDGSQQAPGGRRPVGGRGHCAAAAARRVDASLPGPDRSPVLVGRDAEQSLLLEHLSAAAAGRPSVVVVGGEAGMGKTRLVEELLTAARSAGALVLRGGCSGLAEAQVPFAPVAQAIRGHLAGADETFVEDALEVSQGALARVLLELAAADGPDLDGLCTARLRGLLLRTLGWLAETSPVVLVLEDLHWADSSTAAFVEFLARNLTDERVLVMVTARTDEMSPRHPRWAVLAELDRCPQASRLDLAPLDHGQVGALVQEILGHPPYAGLLDDIRERAGGNPLFVRELVAGHREGAALRPTLCEMLVARTQQLGPACAACLRVLAVAARPLPHEVLTEVTQLAEDDLLDGLRAAVDHQVVVVEGATYRFGHALVAEAHAADLLPGEQAVLHARLAAACARAGAPPAEVAHHWLVGGDAAEALSALVRAAELADRALAHAEAEALYEQAIALWDRVPDGTVRAGTDLAGLFERAAAAALAADELTEVGSALQSRRAMELGEKALAHLDADADPGRAGVLHAKVGSYRWQADEDGSAHWAAALRLLPADPRNVDRVKAMVAYTWGLADALRYDEAVPLLREAIAGAEQLGETVLEAKARIRLGSITAHVGDVAGGRAELERAVVLAERAGEGDDVVLAHQWLWSALWTNDRHEEGRELEVLVAEVARRYDMGEAMRPAMLGRRALQLHAIGRWDECEEVLAELDASWPGGWPRLLPRVMIAAARGDEARLRELVAAARRGSLSDDEDSVLSSAEAQLALWSGRPAEAARIVDTALAALDGLTSVTLTRFVPPLCLVGIRAAADLAENHIQHATREVARDLDRGVALLDRLRRILAAPVLPPYVRAIGVTAEAEAARLRAEPAAARWREAVDAWESIGRAHPIAWAQWRAAEAIILSGGSQAEAVERIDAAMAWAKQLRVAPLSARLAELRDRHQLGPDLPGEPSSSIAG